MWTDRQSVAGDRAYRWATVVLFIAALVLVFATFRDYGVTWDEHYHDSYGKDLLAYYLSGFRDTAALTYHNLWLYGGAFDAPTALVKRFSPFGDYETQHLMIALAGLAGVLGAARLSSFLGGARAGFWAALLLLLTPVWYGQMFNNPKDVPFAAAMTWALYYTVRAMPELPYVPRHLVVKLGLAFGVAFGVRIAAVFAVINLAIPCGAWLALRLRDAGPRLALREAGRVLLCFLLPSAVIAYAVMLAAWPWAESEPLLRPFEAAWIFAHSPWNINTLFEGRLVNSLHLPADYMAVYFAVEMPELVLALLAAAALIAGARLYRFGRLPDWREIAGPATLAFAFLFPFVFFVVFRPVAYDRIRHFLFILPPMAAIAGLALDRIYAALGERSALARGGFAAIMATYLAFHVAGMASLHPDEYVYYNTLVGGVEGAAQEYELDYWGNSYREAVQRLAAYVREEEARTGARRTYRVLVCAEGSSAAYFFPSDLVLARNEFDADFYISVTRLGCDREYAGKTIIAVERNGTTLSVVKDRRALPADQRQERPVPGEMMVARHPGLAPAIP